MNPRGMRRRVCLAAFAVALACACGGPPPETQNRVSADPVVWNFDNLESIGGHPTEVIGNPRLIDTPHGTAVEFDGEDDALLIDVHPLAGQGVFTAELIFRPDAQGPAEQRFFHMQQTEGRPRVLFETRLTDDGLWFLDTYIRTREGKYMLYAKGFQHPIGPWYHAAIVVDGDKMRHYVNGLQEMSRSIDFEPQGKGQTSVGVRINRVDWFKGAILRARFTPRALEPHEFLQLD